MYIYSVVHPSPLSHCRTLSSSHKEAPYRLAVTSILPSPRPWHCVPLCFVDLPALDLPCNHTTLAFCVWLLSLHIMFSRLIHVVICISTYVFLHSIKWIYHTLLISNHIFIERLVMSQISYFYRNIMNGRES